MSVLEYLQRATPFERLELATLIATAPRRYKVYELKKRSGAGTRTIAHPAPEVKLLQRLLTTKILNRLPVHDAAVGYRRGRSIADHAAPHLQSAYLLKLDFSDFFPSITSNDVKLHTQRHFPMFTSEDVEIVARLTTWRNKQKGDYTLSIGAPSSPLISNSILFDFDRRVAGACTSLGVTYTRYADDLAFSTREAHVLARVKDIVNRCIDELSYPRLKLNENKTINVSRKFRRQLVGLILTPDEKISVGRDVKRLLHAAVYRSMQGRLSVDELSNLRGQLAFAWSVEPSFIKTLVKKYGRGAMELLELPFDASTKPPEKRAA